MSGSPKQGMTATGSLCCVPFISSHAWSEISRGLDVGIRARRFGGHWKVSDGIQSHLTTDAIQASSSGLKGFLGCGGIDLQYAEH